MPGFGGQADQHRYMVRLPQQRLQRAELRPQAGLRLRVAGAAIVKNPHSEPGRPPGHRLADAPQPDDPQGGIVQVVAQHSLRIPVAPLPRRHLPHPLFETAGGGDQQTEGDVGGGFGQHVRGVAHRNPELGAGGQINVVHPHRHLADRPQTGGGLQELPVDAVGEHCQHSLRLRNPLQQNLPGNGILQRPYPHRPRRAQRLLHHRKGATGYHYPRHWTCARRNASPASPAPEKVTVNSSCARVIPTYRSDLIRSASCSSSRSRTRLAPPMKTDRNSSPFT